MTRTISLGHKWTLGCPTVTDNGLGHSVALLLDIAVGLYADIATANICVAWSPLGLGFVSHRYDYRVFRLVNLLYESRGKRLRFASYIFGHWRR